MTSRTLNGYKKKTISKPLEQPAFADNKHDNAIVEASGFFCHACVVDKPVSEQSPDSRYCLGCYDFLLKEAEILSPGKHPKWVPRAQSEKDSTGKIGHQKSIQVSGDVVLNMSTLSDQKSEVDIIQLPVGKVTREKQPIKTEAKRGPKHKALPRELISQWAGEGMGSRVIASKLNSEFGIKVSYKTVQRLLSGERRI